MQTFHQTSAAGSLSGRAAVPKAMRLIQVFLLAAFVPLLAATASVMAPVAVAADPVIAAAGDIACDPADSAYNGGNGVSGQCQQKAVSNLLVAGNFAAVLSLGDNQYYCGSLAAYNAAYGPSWGRVKSITHPVVGNHEYLTHGGSSASTGCDVSNTNAAGYFSYFGSAAGAIGQGYYSFNVGAWHLIAINSNCTSAGGCSAGSAQGKWLAADLAAHAGQCTLAYWHIPLFSSGGRANNNTLAIWTQLYAAHVDLVLDGHDHIYERFAPQTPAGVADPVNGIREITVGTGGANHTSITTIAANSLVRDTSSFGILKVSLHNASYDWSYQPAVGSFTDSGSAACHVAGPAGSPSASASAAVSPSASSVPSPTPGGTPTTTTFVPVADSYTDASNTTTNNGTLTSLRVDGSPVSWSFLRFNLAGLSGTVTSAILHLYPTGSQSTGFSVYSVANNTWGETTITYANAPPVGALLGASGAATSGTWTNVTVTSAITGPALFSFGLSTTSSSSLSFSSREGAHPPQLVVTTLSAPPPTASPIVTPVPTASPIVTPDPTASPIVTPDPTPVPTDTPAPTDTPIVTPDPTPVPTDTPAPTDTPIVTPDPTPVPTDTPFITPVPTDTPAPTATPIVTLTPTLPPTPSPAPATLTLNPVADSYVDASNVSSNFGTSTQIRLDGSPVVRSYLRFNVSGVNGTVTGATLRIWANSAQSTGFDVFSVADNTWGETTINNTNAPLFGATKLGSSGAVTAGTWKTVSVTSAVTGNGLVSFGISTTNSTALSLSSREGVNPPQLVIGVNGGPALVVPAIPPPPGGPSPLGAIAPILLLLWPFMLLWSLQSAPLPRYSPRPFGSAGGALRARRAWRR